MTCGAFRDALRRGGEPAAEERAHAEACPRCAAELRARLLLRLGSGDVSGAPAAGFEDRVRARLATADAARTGRGTSPLWSDGLLPLARPALGAAVAIAAVAIALHGWVGAAGEDDLALLADDDPALTALLRDGVDSMLDAVEPIEAADAEDAP